MKNHQQKTDLTPIQSGFAQKALRGALRIQTLAEALNSQSDFKAVSVVEAVIKQQENTTAAIPEAHDHPLELHVINQPVLAIETSAVEEVDTSMSKVQLNISTIVGEAIPVKNTVKKGKIARSFGWFFRPLLSRFDRRIDSAFARNKLNDATIKMDHLASSVDAIVLKLTELNIPRHNDLTRDIDTRTTQLNIKGDEVKTMLSNIDGKLNSLSVVQATLANQQAALLTQQEINAKHTSSIVKSIESAFLLLANLRNMPSSVERVSSELSAFQVSIATSIEDFAKMSHEANSKNISAAMGTLSGIDFLSSEISSLQTEIKHSLPGVITSPLELQLSDMMVKFADFTDKNHQEISNRFEHLKDHIPQASARSMAGELLLANERNGQAQIQLIEGIKHELAHGLPVVESTSTLRQLSAAVQQMRNELVTGASVHAERFGIEMQRLDRLVTRQAIPLSGGLVAMRNPYGFIAVPADDHGVISNFSDGILPEQGTLSVVNHLLRNGDVFVDVGANVGLFTLFASRLVGATGKVFAFEPTPSTITALKSTLKLNFLSDFVDLHEVAVGSEKGIANLHLTYPCGHNSLIELDTSFTSVQVPVVRLDDVIANGKVDLVKIDVEGWELNVLAGMNRILADNPDIAIILEFGPGHLKRAGITIKQWLETLKATKLKIYEIDETTGFVLPLRTSGLESIFSINILLKKELPQSMIIGSV